MPGANIGRGSERHRTEALRVSGDFFPVLGVQPFLGRLIVPSDEVPCPSRTVVVSHAYWQRAMGGAELRPDTTLLIDDTPMQVVGVAPASFHGLSVGQAFEIAFPYCRPKEQRRDLFYVSVMGRLAPGWTLDRATAQLRAASPAIVEATAPTGYSASTVERFKRFTLAAYPAGTGISHLRSAYDTSLWLLLAITGLVLLIACANLANLMLARASTRAREIAVRLALGASRVRLLRQLTTESVLLAIAGAAIGMGVSRFLSEALVRALSTESETITLALATDWRVLSFVAVVAALTCLIFGLVPAFRATDASPVSAMKADGRGLTSSRERFSTRVLVVSQIAVSLVLLVGALLFVRSFRNLMTFDAGLRQDGILITYFSTPSPRDRSAELHDAFQQQLLAHVRAMPGVLDVASTTSVPLTGNSWGHGIKIGDKEGSSRFTWVSPEYFRTMGMRIVEGRAPLANLRLVRERLMALLSGFFGVLAAVLAMLGLYGVISYLVARRRNEIGIRLALGARPDQVVRMVLREASLR